MARARGAVTDAADNTIASPTWVVDCRSCVRPSLQARLQACIGASSGDWCVHACMISSRRRSPLECSSPLVVESFGRLVVWSFGSLGRWRRRRQKGGGIQQPPGDVLDCVAPPEGMSGHTTPPTTSARKSKKSAICPLPSTVQLPASSFPFC